MKNSRFLSGALLRVTTVFSMLFVFPSAVLADLTVDGFQMGATILMINPAPHTLSTSGGSSVWESPWAGGSDGNRFGMMFCWWRGYITPELAEQNSCTASAMAGADTTSSPPSDKNTGRDGNYSEFRLGSAPFVSASVGAAASASGPGASGIGSSTGGAWVSRNSGGAYGSGSAFASCATPDPNATEGSIFADGWGVGGGTATFITARAVLVIVNIPTISDTIGGTTNPPVPPSYVMSAESAPGPRYVYELKKKASPLLIPLIFTNAVGFRLGVGTNEALIETIGPLPTNFPNTVEILADGASLGSFHPGETCFLNQPSEGPAEVVEMRWDHNEVGEALAQYLLPVTLNQPGEISVEYLFEAGPQIFATTSTPQVYPGSASLGVVAQGDEPLTYQWNLAGSVLERETNATLTASALAPNQTRTYTVTVSDAHGASVSREIILKVAPEGPRLLVSTGNTANSIRLNSTVLPGYFSQIEQSSDFQSWTPLASFGPPNTEIDYVINTDSPNQSFFRLTVKQTL